MKKKFSIILIAIVIIVIAILVKNKISNKAINYEIANVEKYTYFKFKDDEKYGVMDRNGKKVIQAQYTNVVIPNPEKDVFLCYEERENSNQNGNIEERENSNQNGNIEETENSNQNIINEERETTAPDTKVLNANQEQLFTQYNNIQAIKLNNVASILCYEKSVLSYKKDGKFGLINFEGKQITSAEYDSIENLLGTEGKFLVSKQGKYGVINLNGAKLVDTKYDKIVTDGYYNKETKYNKSGFIVSKTTEDGYRYGYIDYTGKTILETDYNEIIRITAQDEAIGTASKDETIKSATQDETAKLANYNEIYLIAAKNGQYGLYKGSKEIIKPEYQSIAYADNGAIILEKNDQCGIANLDGKIEVPLNYTEIEQQGIYLYAKNEKQNDVYDAQGNKLDMNFNKTVYETENENYRITTLLNNGVIYYGIENNQGTSLIDTKYAYIEYIYKDYFLAENEDGKYGVINSNGNTEIEFKYDLIQKIKGKNIIQVLTRKSENSDFYSINLEKTASMQSAKIDNKANHIKIYNQTSTSDESIANNSNEESKSDNKNDSKNNIKFLDKDGNAIEETSEIVKKDEESELPEKIGEYKKVQYSLDDAYYTK